MNSEALRILLIEDNPGDVRLIREMLAEARNTHFNLEYADRLSLGLERLAAGEVDLLLLDLSLPDSQGVDTIVKAHTLAAEVPIILLTGFDNEALAMEAMQRGAQDCLVKDTMDNHTLSRSIRYAIERQRLMLDLKRTAAELRTRNEELNEFAHTVAHQVRSLLGYMIGYAGYLEMNHAGELRADGSEAVKMISRSGQKLNSILSELLLLATVRRDEVQYVRLDMRRIVNDACRRLEFRIEEYGGEFVQPDSWPPALGHGSWIEEVWFNYLSNGLKYGGQPPRLELGASPQADGMVRFWVKDNGPGIAPEDQPRLFKVHTRLDQVRVRGEGLGLSIVRRIVEKCKGQVGIESESGAGSTFWFTLPAVNDGHDQ
jgi:two-component system sensor histidine kinase/response regulator